MSYAAAPQTTTATTPSSGPTVAIAGGFGTLSIALSVIVAILFHAGAAVLSYAKYGSVGWAILDFFFASLYYPFYALVLNTPCAAPALIMGGRRRK